MNKTFSKFCLLTVSLLVCFALKSESLSVRNGLSHNGVTSILEDTKGYLWIGTYDGLNLYNGKDFTIFRSTPTKTILCNNRIRSICEDVQGRLWIGTDHGLMIFNYECNTFIDPILKSGIFQNDDAIIRIITTENNNIVALTENGGYAEFNILGELLFFDKMHGEVFNNIISITDADYLIATDESLVHYNSKARQFKIIDSGHNQVYESICPTKTIDQYAVATKFGVEIIQVKVTDQGLDYKIVETLYPQYDFKSVFLDSDSTLWLGSLRNGVAELKNGEKVTKEPRFVTETLRSSCFYEGHNKRLWMGSFDKGVTSRLLEPTPFKVMDLFDGEQYRTYQIQAVDEDNFLIRSNKTYVKYNFRTGEKRSIISEDVEKSIVALTRSKDGYVFFRDLAKSKRLFSVRLSSQKSTEIKLKGTILPLGSPRFISEDVFGNIWVLYTNKVYRLKRSGVDAEMLVEEIKLPRLDNNSQNILALYNDPKDNSLWLATSASGLYHIANPKAPTQKLKVERFVNDEKNKGSISSNFITSIVRDRDSKLWVGTEYGGLCYFDEVHKTFVSYTTDNSNIGNNNIKSIMCDSQNRLWVGTNVGLSVFDAISNKFINYNSYNGLPVDNLTFAHSQIGDVIALAGPDCTFHIDTESIVSYDRLPRFHFGKLKLYNDDVEPNELLSGKALYDKRFESGDILRLNYDQNVLSIDIDVLDYAENHNYTVRYKVVPINENWILTNAERAKISLNGLNPGKYEVKVAVSNALGQWGEQKSLYIFINPPLWRTWWSYCIYIFLIAGLIYFVVYSLLKMQRLSYKARIDDIEHDNMIEKQRYFSNIAHEIKTPLALIVAPVQSLLEKFAYDKEVRERLQRIEIQSRKMTHLIEVAQSIQSSDAGLLKPQSMVFDFTAFINTLLEDFVFLAGYDQKKFVIESPEKEVVIKTDFSMLEKIVNNLLNNAMKYTFKESVITVRWEQKGDNLIFMVRDTGMGIAPSDLPYIFDRFYRGTNLSVQMPSGTGIGLSFSKRLAGLLGGTIEVDSKVGEGSVFTVILPVISNLQPEDLPNQVDVNNSYIYDDMGALSDMKESKHCESVVYVVEDNLEMRLMLERIVGRFYKCESFANGQEALDAMENSWPDLLLSDVMMPLVDGFELCDRVKGDIRTSHIPVILLTACSTYDERIKGMEYGADFYMAKPFYPKYLVTCIETILSGRERLRNRFKSGIPLMLTDDRQSDKDNGFLEDFYKKALDNISNEDINLDSLARELGVNRTHFFQKIKQLTGQTPSDLIKEFRLKKAAQLLIENDMSIEDVCSEVGFKSRTHFSKLFKDKYGYSPRQYTISMRK